MVTLTAIDSILKEKLEAKCNISGEITYYDFIDCLLYDPQVGYYLKQKKRVGYSSDTDFYTAESLGSLFQKLLLAAIKTLLGKNSLKEYTFVEIGTEPGHTIISDITDSFKNVLLLRVQDEWHIPQSSIVFSNELFDAQPFYRLVFKDGKWHEKVIQLKDNSINELLRTNISPPLENWLKKLPKEHIEDYQLDIPFGAEVLFKKMAQSIKEGLFITFDYGKNWGNLVYETHQGTARGYYKHTQVNNLLLNLTEQDITYHICWDLLEHILKEENYQNIVLESQESFFVKHSSQAIEKIISEQSSALNKERLTLMELIHPSKMGQKFQILRGVR